MKNSVFAMFAMVVSSVSTSASAGECPRAIVSDPEKIVQYIQAARGQCGVAVQRASDCSYGSSVDLSIAGAAQGVCEAKFLSKLTSDEKKGYESLLERCWTRFDSLREDGGFLPTMYRSAAAFCQANTSLSYAKIFFSLEQPVL